MDKGVSKIRKSSLSFYLYIFVMFRWVKNYNGLLYYLSSKIIKIMHFSPPQNKQTIK